jgi:replicative DNA helicase
MNKVPPQALEAEKAVLGAILLESEAIHQVSDLLKPEMFYHAHHQVIYGTMLEMYSRSEPIDITFVVERLKSKNSIEQVGGAHTVTGLTNNVVSSYHISSHAKNIVEKFLLRELIKIGTELMTKCFDNSADPFENQQAAEKQLHELSQMVNATDAVKIDTVLIEVIRDIEKLRHRDRFLTGVTTGYKSIDKLTMGWQETDLVIIAARPAVGKTAFTLSLAVNAALSDTPTAFYSLEMGREQLVKRVLAAQAKMFLSTIKGAKLDDGQMEHLFEYGIRPLSHIPLYIDDTASMNVIEFKARLRRLIRKHGIKIAFVDYLQLLKSSVSKNANRQQQIGDISRELKITAKELKIPIIALSQLNREADGKVPQLSNLREAGDLEQDADAVMFLYHQDVDAENDIYLKIAKQRNGALDNIKFNYNKNYQTFTDEGAAPESKLMPIKQFSDDNPF